MSVKRRLPWLATLRDPVVFAREVDPVAALDAAVAHEAAGDLKKAREFYEEMWRRLQIIRGLSTEKQFLKEVGREFVLSPPSLAESRRSAPSTRSNSASI